MHFVAALDDVPEMRAILALFEGVATGAADGYARMTDRPAATLLHLGPGLGNGIANLHNARRARTPIVNIVGDHATYHKQYDAPLTSDIESAGPQRVGLVPRRDTSRTTSRATRPTPVAARHAARAGRDADPARRRVVARGRRARPRRGRRRARADVPERRDRRRRARCCAPANRPRCCSAAARCANAGSLAAGRIAHAHRRQAARARRSRPASSAAPGCPRSNGSATSPSSRVAQLDGLRHLVLVDAKAPVSFFAYPDKPS